MNKHIAAEIKKEVTNLFKQFMAKELDEKELIELLYIIVNAHKEGDKGIWFRWHDGHPLAITVGNIKSDLAHPRNKVHTCECIEATINDNSLIVNFS